MTHLAALGIALGLGLLVGLQRQQAEKPLAGIRTFPLITAFGTICGLLAQHFSPLMVPLGLLAVVILVAVENLRQRIAEEKNPGVTSEAAILLMFGVLLSAACWEDWCRAQRLP